MKPGEYVWIINENIKGVKYYYWMCRKVSPRQIEDSNYSNYERLPAVNDTIDDHYKGELVSELSLDEVFSLDERRDESDQGYVRNASNFPISMENIIKNSYAYNKEFTGEPVPRIAKDCSDLLIQGSNNAHILLGKEKFEETSSVDPTEMTPYASENDLGEQNRKPLSPAIDICILRKARELFDLKDIIVADKEAKTVETLINEAHAGLGSGLSSALGGRTEDTGISYFELEKARESLSPGTDGIDTDEAIFTQEFIDSDIYNCIARIYMTNASTIDDLLFIPSLEGENSSSPQDVLGLGNYGAMVALGANTRIVGTETVKIQNIVGSSGIQFTPLGDVIIHANRDGGAKIVLESGGDIRIVPGEAGIVKIGAPTASDEDAMFVPVGAIPATYVIPNADTGFVGMSEQIMTTAGGLLAASDVLAPAGIPVYATKVKLY